MMNNTVEIKRIEDKIKDTNILVLGVGNYLMGDEGVGVQFIQYLENNNITFKNADILDGGTGGFTLMGTLDSYETIVFVDATMDGKPPGTISLIRPKFASDFPSAISAHDFGLKDMIESMYLLGKAPEMYLFTISINEIKPMHINLSQEVKNAIPFLVDEVQKLISEFTEI
jgi:hydrogenase maturation protease